MDLAIARVARFYSFGHNEIMAMEYGLFQNYLDCMEKISAIELMDQITVASYPHMKEKARKDIYSSLNNKVKDLSEKKNKKL
jgi:hypothetical protein